MFDIDDQPNTLASSDGMPLWSKTEYYYLDRRAIDISIVGQVETAGEAPDTINVETGNSTTLLDNFETNNMMSNNGKSKCVISGEYHAGQYRREIRLDSSAGNWTATNTPLFFRKI
ncbi:hypothetical protein GN244_ATG11300 [Phytophthora infestans]|uniref:Uncharacterized protein n=1 Tax=Phytophthora infestans TaxID=4787 RepID=A0A833WTG5_PHYIN|nr:hypothetical protein GN244_ATG11300 [Phytophthora infestans]KAF4141016.1 hypothetical protein GN958_ATG09864 [Phytophthora infestans]